VLTTLVVLLAFVLPRFELMFAETDVQIPASTRTALAIGRFVADNWWLLVSTAIMVPIAAFLAWRSPTGRERFDRWLLSSRLTLDLPAALATARFLRTLGTLLASGSPLPDAVRISASTTTNRALARALQNVRAALRSGQAFSTALARTTFVPPFAVQLVQVGEETGRLDGLMVSAAEFLDQEAHHKIQRLLSLIVPAAVIVMGCVVAGLIGSVLLGLLSINDLAF
jgi:general secretion pathway protein F